MLKLFKQFFKGRAPIERIVVKEVEVIKEVPVPVDWRVIDGKWDNAHSSNLKSFFNSDTGQLLQQFLRLQQAVMSSRLYSTYEGERGVHAAGQVLGFSRCVDLIKKMAEGEIRSESQNAPEAFQVNERWGTGINSANK